ncbi:site-specific DNA-methyltransferase [Roseibacillus ishigakijimensis]|uniref:Site-specific DNA-methyltransferase n=1 Tax=Roseibacillus ishigakijimensis TaxID=454146 RepID=A0A934RRE9_9BACT|nr:site-specific DNA-methyltransferase [Roseibacillus ishigakijimensis]MBK1835538.1 site-specific DNA-methyltransferase [Roseibacillus ishigakijimensis]
MSEPYDKLAAQLSELFELEKADLDFGIHRIIKARQKHIRVFLGLEEPPENDPDAPTLKKIVQREMGELNTVELERQLEATAGKIKTNYGQLAFANGKLTDGPAKESADGQLWMELREELESGGEQANAQLEAEIYSHLTEFFSRYYDEADFLSKRRIKAGDAPYAVPYSGEEVMLHWANKDQYYIKSSKDLKDYTFTLPESAPGGLGGSRVQFKCQRQDPVLNNNNAKREFHLDLAEDGTPRIETSQDADGREALVIGFHFKIVDKTRTKKESEAWIEHLLQLLPGQKWQEALAHTPEGAKNNLLTRHLSNYTRKNEADFFIHKQLGHFLRGELDFYIKNEVMHLDDIDEKSTDYLTTRVRLIKALRTIAHHLIRFLAQLENFQKKLWLKKKYVTETHYCFTLDRVFALEKEGEALIATLLKHVDDKIRRPDGEMRSQKDEWIRLYALDELADYPADGKLTTEFLRAHDKLMLDTVFYPAAFKWQLLGAMEDLEEQLDGLLIHSENFQALNLLQERYREKVKCVYIDPPYNTGNDEFPYKDAYQHSSWMTMLFERIVLAKNLITSTGLNLFSIDDWESEKLVILGKLVFGKQSHLEQIIWKKRSSPPNDQIIGTQHEYIELFAKNPSESTLRLRPRSNDQKSRFRNPDNHPKGPWSAGDLMANVKGGRYVESLYYPITNPNTGEDHYPSSNGNWRFNREKIKELLESDEIYFGESGTGRPKLKRFLKDLRDGVTYSSIWDFVPLNTKGSAEMGALFNLNTAFESPKPSGLIKELVSLCCFSQDLTLDYFAGSGTTGHAVINLNREDGGSRRYILVEMGDHFDTVLKPRLQKVVYSAEWKDGKPVRIENRELGVQNGKEGLSHGFKYLRLESYEDALNNLDLGADRTPDLLGLGEGVREDYLFSYLLDLETRGHLMNLEHFRDPWGCQLKIHDPHTGRGEARVVDLVETFHYLLGVTVREVRVQGTKDKPGAFLTIEGENPEGQPILIIWRRLEANPDVAERHRLDWPVSDNEDLRAFAQAIRLNPADTEFHALYLNGDHTLADPNSKIHSIEEVFYERMFANTGNPED